MLNLESLLQECNTMIETWQNACDLYNKHPTEANKLELELTLSIATEALKEISNFNHANQCCKG